MNEIISLVSIISIIFLAYILLDHVKLIDKIKNKYYLKNSKKFKIYILLTAIFVPSSIIFINEIINPNPVNLAKKEIKSKLRDPSSAKFGKYIITEESKDKKLYRLSINVNATNAFGGPSGNKEVYCVAFIETKSARCLTSYHPEIF